MSGRLGLVAMLALISLLVAQTAAVAAKSAPTVPSVLRAQDLTGGLQQVGSTTALTSFAAAVVDSSACTETPQSIVGVKTLVASIYAPPGAASSAIALSENAVTFTNARGAKAAFALLSKNVAAAIACPTVALIPEGAPAPVATFKFARVDFPKIANGSYADTLSLTTTTSIPTTQVVFLSRANIVIMGAFGANAPTVTDLKAIATRANKRLAVAMPVPTTTSTTAPKPLTVDPVASRCGEEGKLVSPSSSQAAILTFSNQTGQVLKIYWLDYTGARKPYGEVAPGATTTQATFVGHYWLLADATDHCARIASVDGPTFTISVTG